MKVVFRPCCNNCGYEFQELNGVTIQDGSCRETTFSPSHCPKCHEPIEGIVYFTNNDDTHIFNYSKLFIDVYTKDLKL